MKPLKRIVFVFAAAALFSPACAVEPENKFPTKQYFGRAWDDLKELPTKPFHWDKRDWLIAGGVLGASFSAFAVDDDIRKHFQDHRSGFLTSLSDITTHFGDYKMQVPLILGMWTVALATDNDTLHKIVADGIEASIYAAGIITPAIVYVTGRDLPNAGEPAMKFKPFTPQRYSYPSGHTTEAFAMATVLDQNLRKHFGYWQTPFVYAMATGTAISRIYDHTHYLSDVILGAGIGWGVGYWISNKPRGTQQAFWLLPRPDGMTVAWKF